MAAASTVEVDGEHDFLADRPCGARTPSLSPAVSRSAPVRGPFALFAITPSPPGRCSRPCRAPVPSACRKASFSSSLPDGHAQAQRPTTTSRRARGRLAPQHRREHRLRVRALEELEDEGRCEGHAARLGTSPSVASTCSALADQPHHVPLQRLLLLERGDRRRLREEVQVVGQARLVDRARARATRGGNPCASRRGPWPSRTCAGRRGSGAAGSCTACCSAHASSPRAASRSRGRAARPRRGRGCCPSGRRRAGDRHRGVRLAAGAGEGLDVVDEARRPAGAGIDTVQRAWPRRRGSGHERVERERRLGDDDVCARP